MGVRIRNQCGINVYDPARLANNVETKGHFKMEFGYLIQDVKA